MPPEALPFGFGVGCLIFGGFYADEWMNGSKGLRVVSCRLKLENFQFEAYWIVDSAAEDFPHQKLLLPAGTAGELCEDPVISRVQEEKKIIFAAPDLLH